MNHRITRILALSLVAQAPLHAAWAQDAKTARKPVLAATEAKTPVHPAETAPPQVTGAARARAGIDPQIYSNASSAQFFATFALLRQLLENTWDEKLYQQVLTYEGFNWVGIEKSRQQLADDKIWGPFLKRKLALHKEVFEQIRPLVTKKQKGEDISDRDRKLLAGLQTRIYEQLLK